MISIPNLVSSISSCPPCSMVLHHSRCWTTSQKVLYIAYGLGTCTPGGPQTYWGSSGGLMDIYVYIYIWESLIVISWWSYGGLYGTLSWSNWSIDVILNDCRVINKDWTNKTSDTNRNYQFGKLTVYELENHMCFWTVHHRTTLGHVP